MKLLKALPGLCCVSPADAGMQVSSPPQASRGGQALAFLLGMATILFATPLCQAATQAPVNLGSAGNYVILSKTGITDVPPSPIVGNIGASPITGAAIHITCAEVTGTISAVDAAGPAPCSLQVPNILGPAILDMATAYTDAAGRATPDFTELYAGNLSGKTLVPGLYKWSSDILVDATGVTLSGGPNAVWIFQIAGDVLMANGAHVTLAGGARAMNVFWQVGGPTAVTLGTGVAFAGNILSNKQVIMNTGASIVGRAFAFTQVTLQSTAVTSPGTLVNGIPPPSVPTVTSTAPANLATLVPVGNSLTATFSEAMDPATINTLTFTLKNGLTPVVGTVTPSGITATFVPLGNLLPNTLYTATITTGAKDPEGVALVANYVWTFTTAPVLDVTPPTVISTIPTNGATNVPVASFLSATFSEAMNPLTITGATFLVKQGNLPVIGVVSYAAGTATFQPLTNLAPNAQVTATITTGVKDLAGNAPVSNHLWTFTTGGITDTIAPVVSFTIPSNGAANVPLGNALSATFSEAMDPATISNATFTLRQGNTSVAGVVTYAGVTATFRPASNLAPNLPFTATITTGVKDLAGNALAAGYSWTFNTGATADTIPPTVSSTIPASGAANVPVGNALSTTFSEAMDPLTITTATFSLMQGSTPVAGVVTYTGVTATFKSSSSLAPNLPFTATITTGAKDLAGNALVSNYIWTFTTGASPDAIPPTVSSTIPLGGAATVPVGNGVSATFSEAMDPLTLNPLTFSLKQGNTSVAGVVSYAGVTATFKAASNLTPNLPFTATISTGAKDLAGNALVNTYTWTFTTGASADATPPTVSSTIPSNGATKVPGGNALLATFSEAMDPLTLTNTTFTLKQGITPIAGVVSYAGITATFKPLINLTPNVVYTATISSGAEDLAGNALVSNYTWTFTSGALADSTPPTVTSTIPTNRLANVPVGSSLAATFSEAMDPLTITTVTFSLLQGTTPVAGLVSYAGVSATFRPLAALVPNTSFTATISTGARDLAGNAVATNYIWTFSTGGTADTVPPTLISTSPSNGATFVTTTSDVSATFSEPMNPLTIGTGSVTLWQGQTSIPGTVTYAGITATLRPTVNLSPNTLYSAIVTRAATDLSGNPLPSDTVWTFTTGLSTGQPPVCLVSFAILGGAAITGNGTSTVTGDIGVSPGTTVSGFPPGTLTGATHAGDSAAAQAIIELTAGYGDAVARSVGPVSIAGDLGGQTFTAGLYRSIASITISSGDLVLDAKGDLNAVFIFQVAGTLVTTSGRQVILVNGAQAYNVFWQVGSSATLGDNSFFKGSILADQDITLSDGANVEGRLLARTGTVTLQSNVVTSPPPVIASGGIFNAASFSRTVAAGSIASIFGNNLGSSLMAATMYPLPAELGGSGFLVGNQGAPLYMVSCGQANLQIPWEVSGQTSVPVSATVGGMTSAGENATVALFAPGIFALNQEGSGQGAVEIAPTAVIASIAGPLGRPVKRGEYVAIFCTGLGPVSNQPATGAAALSDPLSMTLTQPIVTIGDVVAHVSYSGLAPGFAGLYQVNAQVPDGVLSGSSITLAISMGGIASNAVTIAVE